MFTVNSFHKTQQISQQQQKSAKMQSIHKHINKNKFRLGLAAVSAGNEVSLTLNDCNRDVFQVMS